MGQFKPMVKMYTTEPSVELKLKKGGVVKKADGGMMGMPSSMPAGMPARGGMMPTKAPMRPPLAARRKAMRPGMPGGMPGGVPAGVPAPASPMPTMKKGGKADAMEALKKHAGKPASKAHKGLKTGGVVMGQGGYKAGGIIGVKASEEGAKEYVNTKMHDGGSEDHTPKKTGDVRMGNAGGYKKGGGVKKFAKGGGVEGNVSGTPPGVTNTKTGEVRLGNAGGYKKGGSAKKAYATGGLVDTGKPVAMPKKAASKPVHINELSGTFKKGGSVTAAEGRLQKNFKSENATAMKQAKAYSNEVYSKYGKKMADGGKVDLSKGAYDKSIGPSEEEMDMAKTIRSIPRRMMEGAKSLFGQGSISEAERKALQNSMTKPAGSVTKTEKSVTVEPAKKRGGLATC